MYAVIRTGGKQYRVTENDVIQVEKLTVEKGSAIEFADVMMIGNSGKTTVGTPLIAGAKVIADVVDQVRAAKILVFKKKRRKNYRRLRGHRQDLTVLRITDILPDGKKKAAKPQPEEAPAAEETAQELQVPAAELEAQAPAVKPEAAAPVAAETEAPARATEEPKPKAPRKKTAKPMTKAAAKPTAAKDEGAAKGKAATAKRSTKAPSSKNRSEEKD
jgi:large subunit ribosomal protein L21